MAPNGTDGKLKTPLNKSNVEGRVKCPDCGTQMYHGEMTQTLVGYISPAGHNHDDNCRIRIYICENGHEHRISKRNSCPACDWKGQDSCFCHGGKKVDSWPEEGI